LLVKVTPFDAEAVTYFMTMSLKEGVMPLQNLSSFQRKQMDRNYDWQFKNESCSINIYSSPCPNTLSDSIDLLK
jgi:hypothetical protein